jgi:polar amino acid transport system permease protein
MSAPAPTPAAASTPGKTNRLVRWWLHGDRWWLLFFAVFALIVGLITLVPDPFAEIFHFLDGPIFKDGTLSSGIAITLTITIVSFFFILIVGMIGGLGRVSHNKLISGIASLYVEVVRGIPVLVWLLWIWYALPQLRDMIGTWVSGFAPGIGNAILGVKLEPFTAAVIGFTVAYGAYMTEIFRAGIQSINRGQMEAARSLGMNYMQAMRFIILPQAVRVIMPPLGNEFVTLLKDSSLVSVLAVSDLTRRGREYVARSFLSFDTFTMVALIYLLLTLFFSRLFAMIERRLAVEKR